jgi:IclR family pca regulon transcriptional regulator
LRLPEIAEPHLEALVSVVHESASMSVLEDTSIVYVARVQSKRIMRVFISVGTRFPAHATSMGRVLLAGLPPERLDHYLAEASLTPLTSQTITSERALRQELDRVRKQGWSIVDQELEEGLRAVAVPVHSADGRVIAAVNTSVNATRTTVAVLKTEILPRLQVTALDIEAEVGRAGVSKSL